MITILYLPVFFCGNFTSGWQECKSNFGRQQFSKYQFDFELKGFQRNFGRKAFILSYRLERTNCSTEFHDSRSFHLDAVHIISQPFDLFEKKKFQPFGFTHAASGLAVSGSLSCLLVSRQPINHHPISSRSGRTPPPSRPEEMLRGSGAARGSSRRSARRISRRGWRREG